MSVCVSFIAIHVSDVCRWHYDLCLSRNAPVIGVFVRSLSPSGVMNLQTRIQKREMNLLRGVFGCTRADQRNREIGESLNVLSLNKKNYRNG